MESRSSASAARERCLSASTRGRRRGAGPEVALLYLAAFPPLSVSAMAGVKGVIPERVQGARSTGMRVSIGFTYTTLVAAEASG